MADLRMSQGKSFHRIGASFWKAKFPFRVLEIDDSNEGVLKYARKYCRHSRTKLS